MKISLASHALIVALGFGSQVGAAAELVLKSGAKLEICENALALAKRQIRDNAFNASETLAPDLPWKAFSYPLIVWEGQRNTIAAGVLDFDIDNDGHLEVLLREYTTFRSELGALLFVFKGSTPPKPGVEVTHAERTSWSGIYSLSGAGWPYISDGFSMGDIRLMTVGGRNYVVLVDVQFGRRVGRSILVAEYQGVAKKVDQGRIEEYRSDDLRIVCNISQQSL